MLRVSVDLMGGDNAPIAVLEAATKFPNLHFVFVGTQEVEQLISKYNIKHYSFVKANFMLEEGKRFANSQLEGSSMYLAIEQVKNDNADFILSAGPSGYYLLLARRILGTLENLNRPALAAMIPTARGFSIMMDLGANLTCQAIDLAKFGVMGAALAKFWLGVEKPKIGFINVGSELGKGPEVIKNAAAIYKKISPECESGFVEGHNIMQGTHDVVIADGFLGNCLLKFGEGMMIFLTNMMKNALNQGVFTKLIALLIRKKLKKAMLDPKKFNGGIFAGINGCVIKSHGASDALSFEYAIKMGVKISMQKDQLLEAIRIDLQACDLQNLEDL